MKVFITGAAGFIGSNLVEALAGEGHSIVGIDNFLTGSRANLKKVCKDIEFVEGDVRDSHLMEKLCEGVEVILHQAAASSHAVFLKDLRESTAINVDGTLSVLQAALKRGVNRVVYASTSSLYGNRDIPFREETRPDPIYPFSVSKVAAEEMAKLFSREHGLETVGLRYMSVYGPHEEEKAKVGAANLVTQFFWDIEKGKSPVIYGDGTQTRDSVYVKDVVTANRLAMQTPKRLLGEIVNVGTARMMSLNEIAAFLNHYLEKDVRLQYVPMPFKNYMRYQLGDLTHASELLGFSPAFDLESGLNDFVKNR